MLYADLLVGNSQINNLILQVPLEGSPHQEDNKYFYTNLLEATNSSDAGLDVRNYTRVKEGRKVFFDICQHFIGEDAVNWSKDRAYFSMDLDRYHRELLWLNYEIYTLVYGTNLCF